MTDWYKIKRVLIRVNEEYNDMQWPCPAWFHVPLSTEWQAIVDAYTGLGLSWGTNFSTYLKMPPAWYRYYSRSTYDVDSRGLYWSSDLVEADNAHCIIFNASSIVTNNGNLLSSGFSVRCLKDSPVTPTSSWTTLYQWSWSAWIFHNPTDWLISISSDGSTWYTLMDKNLWATTVYNNWDTLTNDNCGNVFQWGNNYAFPWTKSSDSIKQSSTRVDASSYWPWNYYNSSTWIEYQWSWSNPSNYNLRWWVTQWSWTRLAEKQIYPAGWKPWENTYIYYPLTSNLVDQMWNWNTGTMTWTCTFDSSTGIYVTWRSGNYVTGLSNWINNRDLFTLNVWAKKEDNNSWSYLLWYSTPYVDTQSLNLSYWGTLNIDISFQNTSGNPKWCQITYDSNWHNWCIVFENNTEKCYVDWTLIATNSVWWSPNNVSEMQLWWWWTYWSSRSGNWYIKDYIVETVARTAEQVLSYYNQTKSNYWL